MVDDEHNGDEPAAAGKLHKSQVPGYEPHFDRAGTHRRALGFVSDDEDVTASEEEAASRLVPVEALGPRNTAMSVAYAMLRDVNTPGVAGVSLDDATTVVDGMFDELEDAGLVSRVKDGRVKVTAAGRTELAN